ncbi:MAG: lipoate--protein ligase family protein [Candidatus Thorarchaeota archaeon]|nr:MAG: lipoate--protein ligase family protein [Candidatus Thorarchaeota archaeon]
MEKIRFLDLSVQNAHNNMAIDEAIMRSLKEEKVPPTLRLYRWDPSAVSIGTFQGMKEEVDLEYCGKNDIDYIRRITGGGAVYHDFNGEITYSIILPQRHRLAPDDILESYGVLCSGVVKGLEHLGIDAQFKPINDIVAGGKKISGNAQTRRHSCVLQHGTTLLDLDVEVMFSILRVPQEKISDKMIADVKERVTSIRDLLGRQVGMDELREALVAGFSEALNLELVPGELTDVEMNLAASLVYEKYGTDEWNLSR